MPRGGNRKNAGRKRSPIKMKKVTINLRMDQIEKIKKLPKYKGGEFIRAAIDEKLKNDAFEIGVFGEDKDQTTMKFNGGRILISKKDRPNNFKTAPSNNIVDKE